jgi:hypothetical protein
MADRLEIFNRALLHIGEGRLTTLTDDVEARYVFDAHWPTIALDGLARGDWNFAQKTAEISQSTTTTVIPGYEFAFDHPTDWVRTIAYNFVADFTDVFFFDRDTLDVYEERGSWFTNSEQFYVRYISSDFTQDANLTAYPPTYVEFIAGLLALRTVERLTQGTTKKEDLEDDVKKMLLKAKSNDARNLKDARPRLGKWGQALIGQTGRRGQIGTLVGGQIQLQEEDI